MPVLDTGEAQLFFTDSGTPPDPAGPPVLLVHGWTCDSHDWTFQFAALEARHRVIAVDLRGHGRSSTAPGGDYTAQAYAADLATLLTRLGTGPVVAVGHSLGACVAAALAVEHAGLVRAMVAVEPAYGQNEQTVGWMRGAAQSFGDEAGNELAAGLLGATEPLAPEWLRTWHRRRTIGMEPRLLARTFHDLYFADGQFAGRPASDRYLVDRRCPTLAFHRLPALAAWEAGVLRHPYGRVVSWEGSGHWAHQERPVEFNALVLDWIAGLPDAEGPDAVRDASAASPPETAASPA